MVNWNEKPIEEEVPESEIFQASVKFQEIVSFKSLVLKAIAESYWHTEERQQRLR